jgi:chemotaxis protein methyltransferase CheR
MSEASLSPREFEQFRSLAHDEFGLDLPDGKQQLLASRLGKRMRELNLNSFQAYYKHVTEDRTGEALVAMIDALTTNHTSFFREAAHFDFLRKAVLPVLKPRAAIQLWSAACSTGEEPYSLAFSLFDELGIEAFSKVRLLATDISTRVLQTAQAGVYPSERFQGIPPEQLRRYVLKGEAKRKDWYLVKKPFRTAVEFRRINLMEDFSHLGAFPVIFCRNVMIYFDRKTQQDLVNRLASRLEPGGYLFIGHAESLGGIDQPLQYVQPAVYRKPDGAASRVLRRGDSR